MPSPISSTVVNQTIRGNGTFSFSSDSFSRVVVSCSPLILSSFEVRVLTSSFISNWGSLYGDGNSEMKTQPWLHADTIDLTSFSGAHSIEVKLVGEGSDTVHLAGWSRGYSGVIGGAESSLPETTVKPLSVPFRTQMAETKVPPRDVCMPTSLAMVCEYYGIHRSTARVALDCYDTQNSIFGNWLMACIAAGRYGLKGKVIAIQSLDDLVYWLGKRVPPIVSVGYGDGDLTGAPVNQTQGHLLVVRGISRENRILVCDPAGKTSNEGCISYDPKEFAAALKGVAIIIEKQ